MLPGSVVVLFDVHVLLPAASLAMVIRQAERDDCVAAGQSRSLTLLLDILEEEGRLPTNPASMPLPSFREFLLYL